MLDVILRPFKGLLELLGFTPDGFSIIFDWLPSDIVTALIWIFAFLFGLSIWRSIVGG